MSLMRELYKHYTLQSVPYSQIARRLGYPNLEQVQPREKEKIEAIISKISSLWKPKAVLRETEISLISEDKIICSDFIVPGKDIALKFKGSKRLFAFAVTAGPEAVAERDRLNSAGEMTSAVITDAVLSEFVEQMADEINKFIAQQVRMMGFVPTMRYSPGYGDLHLSFQKELLDFLQAEDIGIRLNESFLMIPEKSVTALFGLKNAA